MMIYIFMWSMVGFSTFGLQAVLLNLYMVHLGFDAAGIGRFLAVAQVSFGFAALPAGMMGARFGPRTGLLAGTVLVAAGWSLFLLAEGLPAAWVSASLQVGLAIAYMGQATMIVNGAPYLMSITEDDDRFYYLSFQQAIQALLGLIGGFVAGAMPGFWLLWRGRPGCSGLLPQHALVDPGRVCPGFPGTAARAPGAASDPSRDGLKQSWPDRLAFRGLVFAVYPLVVYLAIVGDFGGRTFFNIFLYDLGLDTQQIGVMFGLTRSRP